jgi:hypothetical protein
VSAVVPDDSSKFVNSVDYAGRPASANFIGREVIDATCKNP